MVKRIMLTMADELYDAIAKKRAELGYMTIQEVINDTVRNRFMQPVKKKSRAGRPPKVDDPLIEAFSRRR